MFGGNLQCPKLKKTVEMSDTESFGSQRRLSILAQEP